MYDMTGPREVTDDDSCDRHCDNLSAQELLSDGGSIFRSGGGAWGNTSEGNVCMTFLNWFNCCCRLLNPSSGAISVNISSYYLIYYVINFISRNFDMKIYVYSQDNSVEGI